MTRTVWRISAMRGPRTVAIVAGCAVSAIRLARSDQLNLGLGFRAPRASLRLRAIGRAEFRASVRQVARDGVLTQAETLGDLTICQSSPGELQYLDFPFAEAGPPPTLGHEASASFEIVVAPSETREKLVGARGAERSERFDGRKSRRKRRRGIVDMPHRDLEQDVWTASRRGELDDRLTAHAKRCHAERRVCRDLGRHEHRSPPPCGLEEKRKPARDPGVRVVCGHPGQCGDLRPPVAGLAGEGFRGGEVGGLPRRNPGEKLRQDPKAHSRPSGLRAKPR